MPPASVRTPTFIAARLTEIREARGLNMAELADKLSVTRQVVSRYELQHIKPGAEILAEICKILECDLSFFTYQPHRETHARGTAYFRSLKSATRVSRQVCSIKQLWLGDILNFLDRYIELPPLNLPEPQDFFDKDELSPAEIEDAANLVRRTWVAGAGPISDLALLMENNGIVLSRATFHDMAIDAFSFWHAGRPVIVLGSDKASAARSRFDAAHELGHMILHQAISAEQLANKAILKRVESEANRFAAALLLPAESFGREVVHVSLGHFVELKRRWNVSMAAMISRCQDLGILNYGQLVSLRKQLSFHNYRRKEPLDGEVPIEVPRLIPRSINLLIDEGVATPDQIVRETGIPVAELEELAGLPPFRLQNPGTVVPVDFRLRSVQ